MNRRQNLLAVLTLFACQASPCMAQVQAQAEGYYVGTVRAEWDKGGRTMTLLAPFEYVDPKGGRWLAPKGSVVDGASIPQFAWSIIGGPFEGKYRDASVIHDVACEQKSKPWNQVHETFYLAMLTSGVEAALAKVMYAAVYHFGPRWVAPNPPGIPGGSNDVPPVNKLTESDFNALRAQIESRERSGNPMSPREIRVFGR